MDVVVAGGHGFIGRHVCTWFARQGHAVSIVGRGYPLDRGDVVVHLALFDEEEARRAMDQARGRPMIVASSADVYFVYDQLRGREPWDGSSPGPLDEDAPLRVQLFPYGDTVTTPKGTFVAYEKILVERAVAGATVLRLPKVYGPGDRPPSFAAALRRARAGEPVVVGDRVASWRWTHAYVEDIAHAFGLAATRIEARGRTYNVGELATPTLFERLRALAGDVTVVPDALVPPDLAPAIAQPVDLVLDSSRIRLELGYREQVTREAAMARTRAAV